MKSYNYKLRLNEADDSTQILSSFALKPIAEQIAELVAKNNTYGLSKIPDLYFEVNCNILLLDTNDLLLIRTNEYICKINVYTTGMNEKIAMRYLKLLGMISDVEDKIILKNFIK